MNKPKRTHRLRRWGTTTVCGRRDFGLLIAKNREKPTCQLCAGTVPRGSGTVSRE